jgi:hypothetical protein
MSMASCRCPIVNLCKRVYNCIRLTNQDAQAVSKSHEVEQHDRRMAKVVKGCHDLPGYNLLE